MKKHKISNGAKTPKSRLDAELRMTTIETIMGVVDMRDPREVEVEERTVLARDVWQELEAQMDSEA